MFILCTCFVVVVCFVRLFGVIKEQTVAIYHLLWYCHSAPLYFPKLVQINYDLTLRLWFVPNLMQILSIFLQLYTSRNTNWPRFFWPTLCVFWYKFVSRSASVASRLSNRICLGCDITYMLDRWRRRRCRRRRGRDLLTYDCNKTAMIRVGLTEKCRGRVCNCPCTQL